MAPYLTADEIIGRLEERFGYAAEVLDGDADLASDGLDAMRPFAGYKTVDTQAREFPRDAATVVPAAVLDWVALRAYSLSTTESPGITSESIGRASRSYASPKQSQTERRMRNLLDPYLLRVGSRL